MGLPAVSESEMIGQAFRESADEEMAFLDLTEAEVRRGEAVRAHLALAEQKRVAAASAQIERRFLEGVGQLECVVPAGVYFRMMALHGRSCWNDPDFLKSYTTKNPGTKPVSRADRTTVRVQGRRDERAAVSGQQSAGTTTGGIILP